MSKERNRLDPASRAPLEELLLAFPGGFNAIRDLRERRAVVSQFLAEPELDPRVTLEDRTIPGPAGEQKVRVYRPRNATGALPGLIFVHGCGMILGSVEGQAGISQMLCAESGAVVVSVDYRKAPENPYPAGIDDCYVSGHVKLPIGGHGTAHWWPAELPTGGQQNCPLLFRPTAS